LNESFVKFYESLKGICVLISLSPTSTVCLILPKRSPLFPPSAINQLPLINLPLH